MTRVFGGGLSLVLQAFVASCFSPYRILHSRIMLTPLKLLPKNFFASLQGPLKIPFFTFSIANELAVQEAHGLKSSFIMWQSR